MSEAASTAALIKEIASEARSSGQTIAFDPDAPTDANAPAPARPGKGGTKPKVAKVADDEGDGESALEALAEGAEDGDESGAEGEAAEGDAASPGEIDPAAVAAALTASDGQVDMIALAAALGKTPEELGVSPAMHAAVRIGRRKAQQTLDRANKLASTLEQEYGDRVRARRALSDEGTLDPAIECVEAIFGMPWNDLNKAVAAKLAGKPLPDLDSKRELADLKRREKQRDEDSKKQAETKAAEEKVTQAKAWIATKIKSDKLASPELAKLLSEAGFPNVTDLVFEEMQKGYSRGLTDPVAALEKVRAKLQKQARALQVAGLMPGAPKPRPAPVAASRPRATAQTGAAGNSRPMTDAEMRHAVLKDAGLLGR